MVRSEQQASHGGGSKPCREHQRNWVAGAFNVTHCHFSMRSARDVMRRFVGGSARDIIIGSDKDQNKGSWKKDKDHVEFLCALYQAKAARRRYFVHELTSEVNPRMICVMKIMAMSGARTIEGDLWMLGLARVGRRRIGICQRKRTDGHQRTTSRIADAEKYTGTHRYTRVDATGTWLHQVAQAIQ